VTFNLIPLKAQNLGCKRGNQWVFENLNFSVAPGEILYLKGPNGSGKSSLLRILAGFLLPAKGVLTLPFSSDQDPLIMYLAEEGSLQKELTVKEHFTLWQHLYFSDSSLQERVHFFNLEDIQNVPIKKLSKGEKRRLLLSRLLHGTYHLWLLDEPTLGLDAKGMSLFHRLLEQHLSAQGIIVMATHMDTSSLPFSGHTITLGAS
jgi:heme exporter protein A